MWTQPLWLLVLLVAPAAAQDEPLDEPPEEQAPPVTPGVAADLLLARMYELHAMHMMLGELAWEHAARPEVRDLGEREFRDHRMAARQVRALAERMELDLGLLPVKELPSPTPEMEDEVTQLRGADAEGFDRMYLDLMVQAHEQAELVLSDAVGELEDRQVEELVRKLMPILDQHEQLARELRDRAAFVGS